MPTRPRKTKRGGASPSRHGVYLTTPIVLRATDEEIATWTAAAGRAGVTRTEWIRRALAMAAK